MAMLTRWAAQQIEQEREKERGQRALGFEYIENIEGLRVKLGRDNDMLAL